MHLPDDHWYHGKSSCTQQSLGNAVRLTEPICITLGRAQLFDVPTDPRSPYRNPNMLCESVNDDLPRFIENELNTLVRLALKVVVDGYCHSSEYKPFAAQLSNVYVTILALFCFKLFVRITLNLLTYFYIIRGNQKEAARISAEFYDYGPGQRSWADRSPLHDAACQGRLLSLKTLIKQGHSVNALTIDHVSPLHEACVGNHVSCARALIDAGANVNLCTIDGVTPLLSSCLVGSVSCVESLLESGARPQAAASCQPSPLHEACARGHSRCVDALITWGADVDMDQPSRGTPLYTCSQTDHPVCARRLLDAGANVQLGTAMDTPLHAAAHRDSTELVQLLLDFGADVNVRNFDFKRPVDAAPPGSRTEGFLLVYEATPRKLAHLCRQRIRDCIGRSRLNLLSTLPLPTALQNFVCFR